MASSIRLHISSRPDQFLPETRPYSDYIIPRLEAGNVIIDASRQTSRLEFTRAYPFLPLVTMRCGFLGMEYFGADILVGTCRAEYQPAFRRMFGSRTCSDERPYLPLNRLHVLMAYDCTTQWSGTRQRYPFLASTPQERRALFGRSSNVDRDLHDELTIGKRRIRRQRRLHDICRVGVEVRGGEQPGIGRNRRASARRPQGVCGCIARSRRRPRGARDCRRRRIDP